MSKAEKPKNQTPEKKPEDAKAPEAPVKGADVVEGNGENPAASTEAAGTDNSAPQPLEGKTEEGNKEPDTDPQATGDDQKPTEENEGDGDEASPEAPPAPDENPEPEPEPESELSEEEIARQEAAAEAEAKAAKEEKAVQQKLAKRKKERQKQADDFRSEHEANKKKGLLVYGMNNGARFGELSMDGDITIVIKAKAFDRKSEMLEALKKLDQAIREDRGNE